MMSPMSFRARLFHLRQQKRITQAQLAHALGTTPQTISQWENGRTEPAFDKTANIANALGVPISELFDPVEGRPIRTKRRLSANEREWAINALKDLLGEN